jgi:hypothetical protein
MESVAAQKHERGRKYLLLAWGSLAASLLVLVTLLLCLLPHESGRSGGERPAAVLVFYVLMDLLSVGGVVAGIWSLFGIRSWRTALLIVPGALAGICMGGFNALICFVGVERSLQGGFWI